MCYENEVADKENPFTAASAITRSSFIQCLFCEKKHKRENFRVATEVQAGKVIIKRKKLCVKPSRVAKECELKTSCFNDKNRHLAALENGRKKEN